MTTTMNDFSLVSTAQLRRLIDETEQSLQDLREELESRQQSAQHQQVEQLDVHLKHAELSLASIRDFILQVLSDLRK